MNHEGVEDAGAAMPPDAGEDAAAAMPPDVAEDAQLVARAHRGEVGAFAVLVHRHAAHLHALAGDMDGVLRAFRRAMRRLDRADAEDVAGWLASLLPRGQRPGDDEDDTATGHAPPLPASEVDALWAQLAPLWPRGRRRVRVPRWVGRLTLVLFLLALSVAIPYLVLTTSEDREPAPSPVAEVEGVPLDDDTFDLTFEDDAP